MTSPIRTLAIAFLRLLQNIRYSVSLHGNGSAIAFFLLAVLGQHSKLFKGRPRGVAFWLLAAVLAFTVQFLAQDVRRHKKRISISISHSVHVLVLFAIWKRARREYATLYCALVLRFLPAVMFLILKCTYQVLNLIVQRMEKTKLHGTELVDAEAKCPICLEASCTTVTACKHTFHADCLERWMAVKSTAPTCPVCRASLSAAQDMRSQLRDYFILNYEEWNELHAVFGAGWYAVYWWWLLTLNRWQDFLSQSR